MIEFILFITKVLISIGVTIILAFAILGATFVFVVKAIDYIVKFLD